MVTHLLQGDKAIANAFSYAELTMMGVVSPLLEYSIVLGKDVAPLHLDAHAKMDRGNVICTAGYIRYRAAMYEEQLQATITRLMSQSTDSPSPTATSAVTGV